jgi:ABC-2 type transport system permease protein
MSLLSLLEKEVRWSRHRIVTLLFLLVVLPGFFAYTTVVFQHVVPADTPIGIVAENESVSESGLDVIEGGAAYFSDPTVFDDQATAHRALRRESVYALVQVPPDMMNESNRNATFYLFVDGSMVPFNEPSKAIDNILAANLDSQLPADVSVKRRVVGTEKSLSEFLVPVFLLGIIMLFAFTYLPYNLARESDVFERLRVESSLSAVIAAKITYMSVLLLVPIAAFAAVAVHLGYDVALLSPGTVAVYVLTFVYLSLLSTTIMLLTKFGTLGRFLNVALLFGSITFANLVYPVGFFSALRKEIARQVPLHYSMIVSRSLTLKDVDVWLFADWLGWLVAFTVVCALVTRLAIAWYTRRA